MGIPNTYIPALKYRFLTPLFDLVLALFMPERRFRETLLSLSDINSGHKVLDFGCGTGTLLVMGAKKHADASFTGVDIDEEILEIASKKLARAGLPVKLQPYDGARLPFGDNEFDRVISSLVFHHLDRDAKKAALAEFHRVLKGGGVLVIGDFGKPGGALMRALMFLFSLFEPTQDNIRGLIPFYMKEAGFISAEHARMNTVFGTLSLYKGIRFEEPEM